MFQHACLTCLQSSSCPESSRLDLSHLTLEVLSLVPNRPSVRLLVEPKNTIRYAEAPNILAQVLAPTRARNARHRVLARRVPVEADAARRAEGARPAQYLARPVARPRTSLVQSALPDLLAELEGPAGDEREG